MQGRRIGGVLKALVNGKNLIVKYSRKLHDEVLVLPLIHGCLTFFFPGQIMSKLMAKNNKLHSIGRSPI